MNDETRYYAGYKLFNTSLNNLPVAPKLIINTINQYSFCLAEKNPEFKKALLESEVLLPDGVGILLAIRLQYGKRIKKISGSDIHYHLLNKLNQNYGSCFYLGSTYETLNLIKERIAIEYPNIRVGSFSPPFKKVFSDDDNLEIINEINKFEPDVLFIGMTAPKQETWAIDHKNEINTKIISTVGAVFDFYSGNIRRPSDFLVKNNFEWLGRFLREPKRMWKRYIYYGPVFLFSLLKYKLKH